MKIIDVAGDSTARGMFSGGGGWVSDLERRTIPYNDAHPDSPITVINSAVAGSTLSQMTENLTSRLGVHRKIPMTDTILVLAAGVIDPRIRKRETTPTTSLEEYAGTLNSFGKRVAEMGEIVLYVGIQRVDNRLTIPTPDKQTMWGCTIDDDTVREYDALIREAAAVSDMPYVDLHTPFSKYSLEALLASDGYHPSAFGQELIGVAVGTALASASFYPPELLAVLPELHPRIAA